MKKTILIVFAMAIAGCSLRYDFTECTSDADCEPLTQGNQILACESEQCVVTGEAQECQTDADCTEAPRTDCRENVCREPEMTNNDTGDNNDNDTGSDMGSDTTDMTVDMDNRTPCNQNSECNAGEVDTWENLCIEGFCETAITERCDTLGGDIDAANTQLFGVILPMSDFNIGPPLSNSILLAVDEFNAAGGLPGGRRLTYIVCDDVGSPDIAVANSRHLVDTLKVPAIIGPLFSEAATNVATDVAVPAGTLVMTPTASADTLTTLLDNDLVWRTLSADRWQAKALADRALEFPLPNGGPSRVAILYKDDTYGNGLNASLIQELSARGLSGTNAVRTRPFPDPGKDGLTTAELVAEWQVKLGEITAAGWAPDVYIYVGTTEAVTLVGAYFQSGALPPVPHILSHGAAPGLPVLVTNAPPLANLVNSVAQNIFNGDNFQQFAGRYAGKFPNEGFLTISTLTYDATLAVAFAMAAIPMGDPVTGTAIAANMPKIADVDNGTPITAQGSFIGDAISALAQGNTIDLSGVSGELDFDENGDIRSDYLNFFATPTTADPNVFELATNAVYLYGDPPGTTGFWRRQCDAMNDPCASQLPAGQACITSVGLCLEVGCADNSNPCDDGTCVPQGPGFCAP